MQEIYKGEIIKMAQIPKRYYLGVDKKLRAISKSAFEDVFSPKSPIYTVFGKKITSLPQLNRAQWEQFLDERRQENQVIFIFVGHARSQEMMLFLNGLGYNNKMKVILLLAEETPDTTIIDKFNKGVTVVDYWKYVEGNVGQDVFLKQLVKAIGL